MIFFFLFFSEQFSLGHDLFITRLDCIVVNYWNCRYILYIFI